MPIFALIRRAFISNLRKVFATNGERATLEAAGIEEPTIQHYLVWRRSMAATTVLVTVLASGLTTYLSVTASDEGSLLTTITDHLIQDAKKSLPAGLVPNDTTEDAAAMGHELLDRAKKALSEKEKPESDDDESAEDLKAAGKRLLGDAKNALSAAEKAARPGGQPGAKAGAKNSNADAAGDDTESEEEEEEEEEEPETWFAVFADMVHLGSLYTIPLASLATLLLWTRFRITSRILVIGWALAFFTPILLAFCPWSWWGYVEPEITPGKPPVEYYKALAEGVLEGSEYLIALLPTVLSLIPGVQRACLRVKTLLPESMLPGWFLVAAAPLYAVFLLVVFVAINQIVTTPLLLTVMLLLLASPMVFVVKAGLFIGPLTSDDDYLRMRRVQAIAGGMAVAAGLLLLYYLTTREILGIRLIGLDPKTSLLRPIELVDYALEFLGRLMFMTVLGADLFMRMNLAAWNNFKLFMRSAEVERYQLVMDAMEDISK